MTRYLIAVAFLATIPIANWLIGNVGTVCVPHGPCLVPVAPGLMAPSGVLVIGAALLLRNLLQEVAGRAWIVGCIAMGAALSVAVAHPGLAAASGVAFLCSELADWAVYTPVRRRGFAVAALLAGAVGAAIDSALFLWLAFGSLDFVAGQIVGKMWATLAVVCAWWLYAQSQPARAGGEG